MKVKRLLGSLAAAGTLTIASFGFAGAAFANSITVTIDSPSGAPASGYQGPVQLSASATCGDLLCSITSMSATISGGGKTVATANSSSGTLSYSFNSVPQANGTYIISVSANEQAALGPGTGSANTSVKVNNPPAAPTGVNAALNSSNVPVVTWNANPEPDVSGYEVFRSGSSAASAASFTTAAGTTSLTDSNAPTGMPLSYIVVAVRSSPVWSSGITSCGGQAPCSTPPTSSETRAITVPTPAPVPTSVATQDPAKSAAGSGSGATTGAGAPHQPLVFVQGKPTTLTGPQSVTKVVQQPQPNVVQFAPLLPYSGKVPEVAVTSTVLAPVQAAEGSANSGGRVALPVLGTVSKVNAIKYVATAIVLIAGAVHLTRYARRLTRGA